MPDVLGGRIEPGRVFDRVVGLDDVPAGEVLQLASIRRDGTLRKPVTKP